MGLLRTSSPMFSKLVPLLHLRQYSNSFCTVMLRSSFSTRETSRNRQSFSSAHAQLSHQCRYLHKSSIIRHNNPNYEPDGKTTVTIMNDEYGAPLMIDSYTKHGFKLNNGMQVLGPMVIFPKTVLGWDVGGIQDITPISLALFSILEPKPDVMVIGIGDQGAKIPLETVKFLKMKKINMEILATEHACTTFNFLSGERRCVAGVMIPPTRIVWTAFDEANTKTQKKQLYKDEELGEGPTSEENPFPPRKNIY